MSAVDTESGTSQEVDWTEALTQTLSAQETPEAEVDSPIEAEAETGTETVQESEDALAPLESWSDETKQYFATLDRTGQQFLLDREKDVQSHLTKRTQELSEIQKRYEKLDPVLTPYEEVFRRQGIELAPHVAQALNYYLAYQRDPASLIKTLIQTTGITPDQLGLNAEDELQDPTIRALRDRLDRTERELASFRQNTSQQTQAELVSQITSFKDAVDESGNPKHPHFEAVRTLMAPLVNEGKSLEDAYTQVVWAIPEYRDAAIKAEKERTEKASKEKAEKARTEKVKKAKEAETLPSADAARGNGKSDFKNWDAALKETLSKLA